MNPKTNAQIKATRRRVKVNAELPVKDGYEEFIRTLVVEAPSSVAPLR